MMGMRRFWRVTFSVFSQYPPFWTHPCRVEMFQVVDDVVLRELRERREKERERAEKERERERREEQHKKKERERER